MKTVPRPFSTAARVLRWIARIAGLLTLAILAMFMIGEGFDPTALKAREMVLAAFFPLSVMFGLILGWRLEFAGGLIVLLGLAGFYLIHLALTGGFPGGWAFVLLAVPGVLFLLSAGFKQFARGPRLQPLHRLTL